MLTTIRLCFLVCYGRSGSTLLQSIFDAHPNCCAPIESKFVLHLSTKYASVKNWTPERIEAFCHDVYTNRKFRLFWKVSKETLLEKFSSYTINSFEDACKVVYLSYPSFFEKEQIRVIVDKNPLYSIFIKELLHLFPEAQFIHLVRDPRAVIHSQMQAFGIKKVYRLAEEWKSYNQTIETLKQQYPKKFHTLTYENTVHHPTDEFHKLFAFLGLTFDETLLQSHQTFKEKIAENAYLKLAHHQNITKPISSKNIYKWQTSLSEEKCIVIEAITSKTAAYYGYTLSQQKIAFLKKPTWFIAKQNSIVRQKGLKFLFKLPFVLRKQLYALVSYFFDKKYTSHEAE